MNCLMARIRRIRLCSAQISVTTQNISRLTNCQNAHKTEKVKSEHKILGLNGRRDGIRRRVNN